MSYPSFPSIERLENIHCIITEKIDGTNSLIEIYDSDNIGVKFGSRNRYITSKNDNFGFATLFENHAQTLANITNYMEEERLVYPIQIYGEWFGKGIQRGYNLDAKYFMPFSCYLAEKMVEAQLPNIKFPVILHSGKFSIKVLEGCMGKLKDEGSQVVPGYSQPEGVVIHFPTYQFRLKKTFTGPKWSQVERNSLIRKTQGFDCTKGDLK